MSSLLPQNKIRHTPPLLLLLLLDSEMSRKIVGNPLITPARPIPINNNNNNSNTIIILSNIKPLLLPTTHSLPILFQFGFRPIFAIKAAASALPHEQEQEEEEEEEEASTIEKLKALISDALQGTNRGIFGIPSERKSEIECLVKQLESLNPTPDPSLHLEKVGGCWKLVYSTITILGSKRTKLGLRDFINLGDFFQMIDVPQGKAVNIIKFNAKGFKSLNGELTIEASFKVSSKSRVDIHYNNSKITPEQLMNVFQKNYGLLLGIFNPDGWLEITYIDATMRIGRDDKGNIFILERSLENP